MSYEEIDKAELILDALRDELEFAFKKFPAFRSYHEGYAIIKEEVDELWDDIKANKGGEPAAAREALQIAAMAIRYIVDVGRLV